MSSHPPRPASKTPEPANTRATPSALQLSRAAIWAMASVVLALLVAYAPTHDGLSEPGRHALFVLLLAAGLWVSDAVPAFAVSLAVIAGLIALLGDPARAFAAGDPERWQLFIAPWASPVMWLFLSGLVLASAAASTGLDQWMARTVLRAVGPRPANVLFGVMSVTFVLSMFMSNTATAAMMLALVTPMLGTRPRADAHTSTDRSAGRSSDSASRASTLPGAGFATALLVGIPVASNIGGMATIIGTPPNAIAVAALAASGRVDFVAWMLYGVPPALMLATLAAVFLRMRYLGDADALQRQRLVLDEPEADALPARAVPAPGRVFVAVVFAITILAWMTERVHGVPTAVVAVMPIALFAVTGVVTERDVRALPWDVLILLAGGLALGVGVSETGLAQWLVDQLPVQQLGPVALALLLAVTATVLSNFISNTAAATIITPIAIALGAGDERLIVIPLAMAMSGAMCLPVSTPPNALAFASGRLQLRDLLLVGLLLAVCTPPVVVGWSWVVTRLLMAP